MRVWMRERLYIYAYVNDISMHKSMCVHTYVRIITDMSVVIYMRMCLHMYIRICVSAPQDTAGHG